MRKSGMRVSGSGNGVKPVNGYRSHLETAWAAVESDREPSVPARQVQDERVDLLLVLGSQNSSNSRRLKEIGEAVGKPGYLIDGPHELRPEWFVGVERVLITAGASALPGTWVENDAAVALKVGQIYRR